MVSSEILKYGGGACFQTVSVDLRPEGRFTKELDNRCKKYHTHIQGDVKDWAIMAKELGLLKNGRVPVAVWASPDCATFSTQAAQHVHGRTFETPYGTSAKSAEASKVAFCLVAFYIGLRKRNPHAIITIENPCPQKHDSEGGQNVCLFQIEALADFLKTVTDFKIIEVCYCKARFVSSLPTSQPSSAPTQQPSPLPSVQPTSLPTLQPKFLTQILTCLLTTPCTTNPVHTHCEKRAIAYHVLPRTTAHVREFATSRMYSLAGRIARRHTSAPTVWSCRRRSAHVHATVN
mmetsp:Transcript_67938/g.187887  ORF Transcript_67938/g.187887 Transcript_67938/m.187887 type:complete len:290 (+) Transcript_67938:115-984(+)